VDLSFTSCVKRNFSSCRQREPTWLHGTINCPPSDLLPSQHISLANCKLLIADLIHDLIMTDKRIVLTTTGSEEEARKIARHLVEGRMAACVNIVPHVTSIYRWKENIEEAGEWLLLVKTTAAAFEKVSQAIAELHSYDLPECVCLTIEDGSPNYLRWITESVAEPE
jgi:periplasmic divalent cation tolerance protein